ncbi:MAG: BMP family ABC transporter substrate-binding protein [Eubacterium sp.]|nr:BMP family ABC transporter substrate-binding protein [Eubacterium sp.]
MSFNDYIQAAKLGKKDYQSKLMEGKSPTLQVLDDILHATKNYHEVSLGLVEIPLEQIVGTKTTGRSNSFSSNFMPILDSSSEFATKWIRLCASQQEEGIKEPIKAYEYMNKFYVLEGNKRVSVLKYFDAVSIVGEVIRILPKKTDDLDIKIYYEYMDFYELSKINYLYFSKSGCFEKLQTLVGKNTDENWSFDDKMNFRSLFQSFKTEYRNLGGDALNHITCGDAFLAFVELYGYDELLTKDSGELNDLITLNYKEFELMSENEVELRLTASTKKASMLSKLLPTGNRTLKVAFIYEKTSASSSWTYSHELGRLHIEESFPEEVSTTFYDNVNAYNIDETIEDAIDDDCDVIFTTSPTFSQASLKAALANSKITILNCSLHDPHSSMRTYYSRMHEAKFIMGAVAGAMTENNVIGYIADYPIYGTIANINAFALGVKMTNPRANIHLMWSCLKDLDIEEQLKKVCPDIVSDKNLSVPEAGTRYYGLYKVFADGIWNLAIPVYHWGRFYEQLIRAILDGTWKSDDTKSAKAINYWWGMAENAIDIISSPWLPEGTKRLMELLTKTIRSGDFNPFSGVIYSQDKTIRNGENQTLSPDDIITMDWLSDNIIGEIPVIDELEENAKPVAIQQGLNT